MKTILSLVALSALVAITGCVSVERNEPERVSTRTTTVDTPVTPAASVTTQTTTY